MVPRQAPESFARRSAAPTSEWQRPHVLLAYRGLRQRRGDRVTRRTVVAVALRDGPLHHRADALAPRRAVSRSVDQMGSSTDMAAALTAPTR